MGQALRCRAAASDTQGRMQSPAQVALRAQGSPARSGGTPRAAQASAPAPRAVGPGWAGSPRATLTWQDTGGAELCAQPCSLPGSVANPAPAGPRAPTARQDMRPAGPRAGTPPWPHEAAMCGSASQSPPAWLEEKLGQRIQALAGGPTLSTGSTTQEPFPTWMSCWQRRPHGEGASSFQPSTATELWILCMARHGTAHLPLPEAPRAQDRDGTVGTGAPGDTPRSHPNPRRWS